MLGIIAESSKKIRSNLNLTPISRGVKICTYEDPEKAAAEPTVARMATAENFILDLDRQKIVSPGISNLD